MRVNYETKVVGFLLGLGIIWGSLASLFNKILGLGFLIGGIMSIIFWFIVPGEESK